jgi:predicted GNAT family acetyltransferase
VQVKDAPAASRYEVVVDGVVAGFTEYRLDEAGGILTFVHTETDPARAGQGLGSTLAAGALDDVRRRGLRVIAECEFIAGYLERHPAYQDLLAG